MNRRPLAWFDGLPTSRRRHHIRSADGPVGPILKRATGREARIEHYEFARIVVNGQEEKRDLIVLPNRVVRNWWRREGHALVLEDLDHVLDDLPERLVIGTGAYSRMRPDQDTIERLEARGVTVESLPTGRAVRRYASCSLRGRPPLCT
jgi:hypothetical protein